MNTATPLTIKKKCILLFICTINLVFCINTTAQNIELIQDFGLNGRPPRGISNAYLSYISGIPPILQQKPPTIEFNSKTYFCAKTDLNTFKIYETDGTISGTIAKVDLSQLGLYSNLVCTACGLNQGGEFIFKVINNELYFLSFDANPTPNMKLYKTDLTQNGTILIRDFQQNCGAMNNEVTFNNQWIFEGGDPVNGCELWKTDGTSQNTSLVKNLNTTLSGSPNNISLINGNIIFGYRIDSSTNTSYKIGKSDGTFSGTSAIRHKTELLNNGTSIASQLVVEINNSYYFMGRRLDTVSSYTNNPEILALFKTNGDANGTIPIKHFIWGGGNHLHHWQYFGKFDNTKLYYTTTPYNNFNNYIGFSDTLGNSVDIDSSSGAFQLIGMINGALYYSTGINSTNNSGTRYICKTNGINKDTIFSFIYPYNPLQGSNLIDNYTYFIYDNKIYFNAPDPSDLNSKQLWVTDGTTSGTTTLIYQNSANISPDPNSFFISNGEMYFSANYNGLDYQLYKIGNSVSGINEISIAKQNLFYVYPNPSKDIIYIGGKVKGQLNWKLNDILGKEISSGICKEISVRNLTKGFYFISISDGLNIEKKKVLVE